MRSLAKAVSSRHLKHTAPAPPPGPRMSARGEPGEVVNQFLFLTRIGAKSAVSDVSIYLSHDVSILKYTGSIPYSLRLYILLPHVHGTRERDPKFRSTYGWHTQSHKVWTQIGSCLASSCLFRLLSCSGGVLEEGRLLAAAEEPRQQRSCQQRLPAAAGSMPRYHQLPSVDAAEVLPAPGVQQLQTKAAPAARAARSKLCCRASLRPRRRDYAARRRACRRARRAPGRSLTLRPPSPCPCPCPICCLPCRDLRTLHAPRRPPSSGWR